MGKAFGIKGDVHLYLDNLESETLKKGSKVELRDIEGNARYLTIENIRYQPNKTLVLFKGYDSPEQAAELVGLRVGVDESQLPQLEEGEFYLEQLMGCEVVDTEGLEVGKVKRLYSNGAQTVVVIAKGYQLTEIPLVDAFFVSVDVAKKLIVINRPEYID